MFMKETRLHDKNKESLLGQVCLQSVCSSWTAAHGVGVLMLEGRAQSGELEAGGGQLPKTHTNSERIRFYYLFTLIMKPAESTGTSALLSSAQTELCSITNPLQLIFSVFSLTALQLLSEKLGRVLRKVSVFYANRGQPQLTAPQQPVVAGGGVSAGHQALKFSLQRLNKQQQEEHFRSKIFN